MTSLAVLGGLAAIFGIILGFAHVYFKVEGDPIIEQIDALLPQTQCGQCGHPGCRPYAEGIANGEAINKCPPGGQTTINALADLLDVEAPSLDAEHGKEKKVKWWLLLMRTFALAALNVFKLVRLMPFLVRLNKCIPSLAMNAQAVIYVLIRAQKTASI